MLTQEHRIRSSEMNSFVLCQGRQMANDEHRDSERSCFSLKECQMIRRRKGLSLMEWEESQFPEITLWNLYLLCLLRKLSLSKRGERGRTS